MDRNWKSSSPSDGTSPFTAPSPGTPLPSYPSSPDSQFTVRRHKSQSPDHTIIDDDDDQDNHPLLPLSPGPTLNKHKYAETESVSPIPHTAIYVRILGIIILVSLFSWFYLEALAGGDIEWVKDNLSMLGLNLTLSVVCLTAALTLITITPMSRIFASGLVAGILVILYSLKRWDDGESFEAHGAYNMLVFLVVAIPLNTLIQSILACQQRMQPNKFKRFMTTNVMSTIIITTMMLTYYSSIWGRGALGAQLQHGMQGGVPLCEWQGLNIPFVDLLPNRIQNFWAGSFSCPTVSGIEAEWNYDGVLTIHCLNKEFTESGKLPRYDILPDTRPWGPEDKIMHTYNHKIDERTIRKEYTEPVVVNEPGVESLVAHCEEGVSKVLIRVLRNDAVLERVRNLNQARKEQEETTGMAQEDEDNDTNDTQEQENESSANRKPNVLVLFMDAVARRQFYRKLAKTSATVAHLDKSQEGGPQLHEFFRYHSVGFNTNANSAAIYTNASDLVRPAVAPIWKDFYEGGYITTRVEDNCEDWSTQYTGSASSQYFDHELQAPFCLPPYYPLVGNPFGNFDGPYSIVRRCLHGTNVHNYAFEYMNQFRQRYTDQPWFQMGSLIEGHEGTGEVLLTIDDDLSKFFEGMERDGTLENTIIFTMADHGLHMGINFMFTPSGRIEHMNPYLSVILPPLLSKKYPSLARGLQHNQQSLVTGWNIHATLKMLARGVMPAHGDDDETDGGAWRKGTLFDEELNPGRTCEEARIPEEFCKCR
ncbi:hypothetical protein BGZ93_010453 [Podila epicladia]|nr:hypothetical protein BGZ92_011112 [Podila epicladia]KAG0088361.1 hypothetical protein BGZ93_010453 [Podila epicladia]